MTMSQSSQCGWLIRNRRHLKKIVVVGCCLGIALIIINTDDLFNEFKGLQVQNKLLQGFQGLFEGSRTAVYCCIPHKRIVACKAQIKRMKDCKSKLLRLQSQTSPELLVKETAKDVNEMSSAQHHLWMEIMSVRMEKRRKKLQENCELLRLNIQGNDSLHRPNEWEFLINRPFRLVWCNVFKAASTSWMYNFNILAGYKADFLQNTKEVPLQLARKKYPRPSLKSLEAALNDSTSFLIVRHPFERLLSGYRDKIEYALPNTYHYKLGNYIVMKFRQKTPKTAERTSIFEYLKNRQKRPTFFEFVEFVIHLYQSGKPLDMHWTPITTFCTPCQVRFDIIMKFETLQEDQNYLIQKKKLQNWIKPQWKNPTKGKSSVISLVKKYYTQLNASQIYQLYNIYRYDFYLFDYTLDDYLKYLNLNQAITNEMKIFL